MQEIIDNAIPVHDRTENACTVSTPVVPYKALEKFSKGLYGTTGGTYSAGLFHPVMQRKKKKNFKFGMRIINGKYLFKFPLKAVKFQTSSSRFNLFTKIT